ncbi:MAG: 30S ribosomal protein S20 [candidate division Zixibacteria bacterium RBG_16_53_22]|nr:MAG: 30S ribosomal protein S20 [candidate division Zixibacteria bacterium RBG_16_53_22]
MPTHKSAAKRMKTAERDRQKNKRVKSNLRAAIRDYKAIKSGQEKAAEFKELTSVIDSAAKKGVIHKNKAARTKSRLSRLIKTK